MQDFNKKNNKYNNLLHPSQFFAHHAHFSREHEISILNMIEAVFSNHATAEVAVGEWQDRCRRELSKGSGIPEIECPVFVNDIPDGVGHSEVIRYHADIMTRPLRKIEPSYNLHIDSIDSNGIIWQVGMWFLNQEELLSLGEEYNDRYMAQDTLAGSWLCDEQEWARLYPCYLPHENSPGDFFIVLSSAYSITEDRINHVLSYNVDSVVTRELHRLYYNLILIARHSERVN